MGKPLGRVEKMYIFILRDMTLQPRNLRDQSPTITPCNPFFLVVFSINIDIQGVKKDIALRGVPNFKVIRLKEGEGESSELAGLGFKLNP